MRPRVAWMTGNDDTILEFLEDTGAAHPPQGIKINLDRRGVSISKRTISRRLDILEDACLVEKVDEKRGYYELSEKGRAYLNEELDSSELQLDE